MEKIRKWRLLITFVVIIVGFLFLPVVRFNDPTNTILEDSQGVLLSARITEDGQWRFPDCDSVPQKISACILHYEDQYFRKHPGVNPVSLTKALFRNIQEGEIVRGGSTITMQVVRLSRKGKPRNLIQKCIEIALALRLELKASKTEILELYASHAPFGGNVVGIDAASWRYYGRPAYKLSWGEAATLAVLPNAPSLIHPGRNRKALEVKRNLLLDKLRDQNFLDSIGCELAKYEPIPESPHSLPQMVPHLLDRAEKEGHRGERIVTSIQEELQTKLVRVVERHHQQLKQNEIHNAAVLILNIPEQKVIAYVGNTTADGEGKGGFVDIIAAPRSSGSILKPLLFSLMLDEGEILPHMLIPDIPTHISGYSPLNFDRTYSGAVPASRALIRSLNVPAVRMLRTYGVEKFHSKLQTLGFTTVNRNPGHYGLTLILGGAEVSLWDLCRTYMGMASSLNHIQEYGYRYNPEDYASPSYISGNPKSGFGTSIGLPNLNSSGMMSAASIWQCFETLTELERPTQEGSWERFSSSQTIAWKTGTSFGYRDAWAIGLNPEYLVGVWFGNADGEGRPGLTGVNAAAPLMFEAFGLLPSVSEWFDPPYDELTEIEVCSRSGFRAGSDCDETEIQLVPKTGEKMESCPYHKVIHLEQGREFRVHSDCYDIHNTINTSWFVLPPVMEWYYKKRNSRYQSLPPYLPGCLTGNEKPMELIYPKETMQIFIPRGLDGELSRVVFEAAHRNTGASIYWHLDNLFLGETSLIHQMEFISSEGWHTLTLVDSEGNHLEKKFEVVGN